MKGKYMTIFLMGLLCLVSSNGDLLSQNCYKVSYDKNGNRISFFVTSCSEYYRGDVADGFNEEELCEDETHDLQVYPNPSDGRFRIEFDNDASFVEAYIYDNKGILVCKRKFNGEMDIDISDCPAGAYLLRLIGDEVRSVVVVKL